MRRTSSRTLPALALLGLLTAGCSQGSSSFNGNQPDGQPAIPEVVRTPSPLGTDLPSTDPPLVVPLPGATGGLPGSPQATAPEASPGERTDPGNGAPAN